MQEEEVPVLGICCEMPEDVDPSCSCIDGAYYTFPNSVLSSEYRSSEQDREQVGGGAFPAATPASLALTGGR
jgi:hypothetical protein